jgi:hypothetical protein
MQVLDVVGLATYADGSERYVGGSMAVSPLTMFTGVGPELQILRDTAVKAAKSLGRLHSIHIAHGLGKAHSRKKASAKAFQIALAMLGP